ncbi:DNA internalization-related competence protein ComEC/Rec2 [Shewanella sp.]|uniref:DNA internalization-related competence protein ComEC/Rec2 n=1 Tax=Shewanella sp. TaxID=50422 RepID=UPI003569CCA5
MKNPFLLGFCALNISSLLWPALLPWPWSLLLLFGAVLLYKPQPLLAGGMLGIAWVCLYATLIFDYRQPEHNEQNWLRAEIIASVTNGSDWLSIDIRYVKPKLISPFAPQMRLNWRTNEQIRPGEVWEFRIDRRSISSNLNQGAFNAQRYLLSKHIGLRGRVIEARPVSRAPGLRFSLIERIRLALESQESLNPGTGMLLALLGGEQGLITSSQWQQLRQTGTGHLMAISGLHMSVLALWLYGGTRLLLLRFRPRPDRQNLLIAMIVAACGCLLYGLLAGMGIPTRRAFIMLAMVAVLTASRRFASPWERLLYALSAVLVLDPLSPLSAGFWLSFGAIGIILLVVSNSESRQAASADTVAGRFRAYALQYGVSLIKVQLALSLGLGLVQLLLFGGVSVHSIWINLLMVPWFSLLVIPLALLGLLVFLLVLPFGFAPGALFLPALYALLPFNVLLEQSDRLPLAWVSLADQLIAPLIFALVAVLLLWMPVSRSFRIVSTCLLLPFALSFMPRSQPVAELHLLDVGQGLAAVVFDGDKTLVYDTGSAYGGFSHGERTLTPFLRARGRSRIDVLIISHEDKDHAGGAEGLAKHFPVSLLISDTKVASMIAADVHTGCRPASFQLNSLSFSVLAPPRLPAGRVGNDSSCVVRITGDAGVGQMSLLLPGDIEAISELRLLQSATNVTAKVLIAPHHGSLTSSTDAFIKAVSPALVLFAAGADNRYGFPKKEVVERYQSRGISGLSTASEGQISLYFTEPLAVKSYRHDLAPFWYNRVFGVGDWPITE